MPKKIHDKVRELLDSKTFYPEKSKEEREDLAWPIATNIIKESSFNLRRFVVAQVNQDLLKSNSIEEFVEKFSKYGEQNPGLVSKILFSNYIKANSTYNNERLSKYPAFVALLNYLNTQNRVVTKEEIKKYLDAKQTENPDNFKASIDRKDAPDADKSDAPSVDLTKQQPKDEVLGQLPGVQKSPIPGVTGLQNVIQYTSQSAAGAPKNEAQKAASERMFMMDNLDEFKVLSRNIFDENALRNFEKNLTFSKNHIGTRFEEPVNRLLDKYGELATNPNLDRKTKTKLGAEIQYIIQNQLLGSGVRPSVVFDAFRNPFNSNTDYVNSKSKFSPSYQINYLEDVYYEKLGELTQKFKDDRKAFAEDYIEKLKQRYPDSKETPESLSDSIYPIELQLKPGSPSHKREWMENNKKSVLDQAFGAGTGTAKGTGLRTIKGPAFDEPTGDPNKAVTPAPPVGGAPAPPVGGAPAPPPASEIKTTASRNLQKFKYNNRRSASAK